MTDSTEAWAAAVRAMAQHAVIAGLVRTHPDREALQRAVEQFAEAHRTMLLKSSATDEHLELFEHSLHRLLGTPLPPSTTPEQR